MASLHSPTPYYHFPHSTKNPHHTTTSATATATATTTTSATATATRRSTLLLLTTTLFAPKPAIALDFRMTVPDQTVEEAEAGIQSHAQSLLNVKDLLLTSESWKEAQKQLRKSSSLLKQDIYTIIQAKSPAQRPRLRMLYSDLFTAVTKLDYAARDKDRIRVWECYHTIVLALHHILSTLVVSF